MFNKKIKMEDVITLHNEWNGKTLTLKDELQEIRKEIVETRRDFHKFKARIEEYLNIDITITPEVVKYDKVKKGKKRDTFNYTDAIRKINEQINNFL